MTAAFIDVQKNPENAQKYENNPKIKKVMDKLLGATGMGGAGPGATGGAGMGGAGPGATGGARAPPTASSTAAQPPPTASAGDMDLD